MRASIIALVEKCIVEQGAEQRNRRSRQGVQTFVERIAVGFDARGLPARYPAPFAVNLFADDSTFVEPDISVVCDRDKLSDRGCEGAPDMVVEVVSPSNPEMDYVSKLNLYREAGVREYWICDPMEGRTVAYVFDSTPMMHVYPFSDAVPSEVLGGLSVDFSQIVADM